MEQKQLAGKRKTLIVNRRKSSAVDPDPDPDPDPHVFGPPGFGSNIDVWIPIWLWFWLRIWVLPFSHKGVKTE
jgi:hypothetical protein